MNSRPRRKPGFALNREDYIDLVRDLISPALHYFISAKIPRANVSEGLVFWWESEVVRRLDLQLPNWISIAPANGRFNRIEAIEEAIGGVERRIGKIWTRTTQREAEHRKVDPSTLILPDQEQLQAMFLSRVRITCAASLQNPQAKRMAARPRDVFVIWDHISTALTFQFEIEIATANSYLTHLIWWEDRVGTHLESCLAGFLERRSRTERDMGPAIAPGIALVPVHGIWNFTVTEIARQLAKRPEELLLPDRTGHRGGNLLCDGRRRVRRRFARRATGTAGARWRSIAD